ncbi:hypothetical protein PsAD13_04160 [Pseudovibrio sp. Ad13]|nr:hypothetical protein PsAD13_04160 [Pseudovibrio sp. Ad13]
MHSSVSLTPTNHEILPPLPLNSFCIDFQHPSFSCKKGLRSITLPKPEYSVRGKAPLHSVFLVFGDFQRARFKQLGNLLATSLHIFNVIAHSIKQRQ